MPATPYIRSTDVDREMKKRQGDKMGPHYHCACTSHTLKEITALPVLSVLTIEGSHVHGDGGDEALALVELALQQLAEHVQRDELVAVQDGALREGAETYNFKFQTAPSNRDCNCYTQYFH